MSNNLFPLGSSGLAMSPIIKEQVKKKQTVLVYSDFAGASTGFATVSRHIMKALHQTGRYDLSQLAINYYGDFFDRNEFPYNISPARLRDPSDPYGRQAFLDILQKNNFDIVLIINDTFIVESITEHVEKIFEMKRHKDEKIPKLIYYYPVDCHMLPHYSSMLKIADRVVAYTEFGKRETEAIGIHPTDVIYHGTDINNFYPIGKDLRRACRAQYLNVCRDEQFVLVTVNRNSPRKDIARTILAFSEFRKRVPDSILYIHAKVKDSTGAGEIDLSIPVKELGLDNKNAVFFPKDFHPGVGVPREILNQIYNMGDLFITTTLGEGFGLCVEANTIVNEITNFKPIKEICIGDQVMTRDGRYHSVLNIVHREDKILQFSVLKHPDINVTPQHPFLAKRSVSKAMRVDATKLNFKDPEWIQAKDLKKNDWVAIVKPKQVVSLPDRIDLKDYLENIEYDDKHVWYKMGYSPFTEGLSISDIQTKYQVSKRVAEDTRRCILGTSLPSRGKKNSIAFGIAQLILDENLTVNKKILKINRYIPIDENFLSLLGWYIAEGNNGKGTRIELDFHIKEFPIAVQLGEYMEKTFGAICIVEQNGKNKCRCRVSSKILGTFFGRYCGIHCQNKKIPTEIAYSYHNLAPLVKGVMLGDGYFSKQAMSIGMTSRQVIWQLRDILLANDIFPNISNFPRKDSSKLELWQLNINGADYIKLCSWLNLKCDYTVTRRPARHYMETTDMYFVRIKNIQTGENSPVCDLSIQDCHSFIGNGILLHNTHMEAMATGTPILVPNNTVFPELVGSERGYMYECKEVVMPDNQGFRPVGRLEDIVDQLFVCYDDWVKNSTRRQSIIKNAQDFTKKYSWAEVCKQWIKLFDEVSNTVSKNAQIISKEVEGIVI